MIHRVNVEFPDVYILVRLYRNFSRPWDEFHQSIQPAISSIKENIDNYRGNVVVLMNDDSWTDDEDRIKYIKAMNTERDTYNQIEYARETGREEGREEGRKEGLKVGQKDTRKDIKKAKRKVSRKVALKAQNRLVSTLPKECWKKGLTLRQFQN